VSAGIRQLREAGYLRQERGHDGTTGTFVWHWEVTDDPAAFAQVSTVDGYYLSGVVAAAMVAPVGQPYAQCAAVLVATHQPTGPARRAPSLTRFNQGSLGNPGSYSR
jgi:hypothetical protein